MNCQAVQKELEVLFGSGNDILVCKEQIYINGFSFYLHNINKLEVQRCIKNKLLVCETVSFNIYDIDDLIKIKEKADDILKILLKHIEG